ncbi:MAG: hypothetical protein H7A00_08640 [Hahellaceae bacterium]|nr:hypothetical protein [Hahellaceae bacterium]
MQPVINIALRAARQANEFIQHSLSHMDFSNVDPQSNQKKLSQLQTAVYRIFFDALKKAYPTHYIAEIGAMDADGKDNSWHLYFHADNAAIRSLPLTAYSLIYKIKGRAEHTIVVNALTNEEFSASRTHNASVNGRRMRVSEPRNLEHAYVHTNILEKARGEKRHIALDLLNDLDASVAGIRVTGCSAIDLAWVAAGKVDAAVIIDPDMDELAGVMLLCQEAGALAGTFNGGPASRNSRQLVVANSKIFKSLLQRLHTFEGRL